MERNQPTCIQGATSGKTTAQKSLAKEIAATQGTTIHEHAKPEGWKWCNRSYPKQQATKRSLNTPTESEITGQNEIKRRKNAIKHRKIAIKFEDVHTLLHRNSPDLGPSVLRRVNTFPAFVAMTLAYLASESLGNMYTHSRPMARSLLEQPAWLVYDIWYIPESQRILIERARKGSSINNRLVLQTIFRRWEHLSGDQRKH